MQGSALSSQDVLCMCRRALQVVIHFVALMFMRHVIEKAHVGELVMRLFVPQHDLKAGNLQYSQL